MGSVAITHTEFYTLYTLYSNSRASLKSFLNDRNQRTLQVCLFLFFFFLNYNEASEWQLGIQYMHETTRFNSFVSIHLTFQYHLCLI